MIDKSSAAENFRQALAVRRAQGARASLTHLRTAIDLDPTCAEYWRSYCEVLVECGETATALAVANRARLNGLGGPAMKTLVARFGQPQPDVEGIYHSGTQAHQEGRLADAVALYRKALSLRKDFPEAQVNLGSVLQAQGAVVEAIAHFEQAIAIKPDFAEAHYNLGNALALCGGDPIPSYARAISARPDYALAHFNLGIALEKSGRTREAMDAYRAAAEAAPDFAEAHVNVGVLLFAAGDFESALAAYDTALRSNPQLAAAHSNKGNVFQAKGALELAALSYQSAIAANSQLAEAHYHLANIRRAQRRFEEAVAGYRDALGAKPDFVQALYDMGYTLSEAGQIDEGFKVLTRYAELSCSAKGDPGPAHRQLHDQEQREHFGPDAPDPVGALWLAGGERLAGPAISPANDIETVQQTWATEKPQIVIIDNFLTADALAGLRRFCAESTIWREAYEKGYLGAFPEHGVCCPLLAQIAEELKSIYPVIFQEHPLLQLWAFKYQSRLSGIPLHADFAAVNVNFWITPDDANMDDAHGGLVIWNVPAPLDWDFQKYNVDPEGGRTFLAEIGARAMTIPYRANRAVIFDSDLFHETDTVNFRDGYLNRRINITLLYGRRTAPR